MRSMRSSRAVTTVTTVALLASVVLLAPACGSDATSNAPPVEAGDPRVKLAPGEATEIAAPGGSAAVRLATPDGTERFVVVLASTKLDGSSAASFPYSISTSPVDAPTEAHIASGCALAPDKWSTIAVPRETPPSGNAAAVGATRQLRVEGETISANVVAVSDHAVVWADTTPAHPAVLDPAFVSAFLADFDKTILPRERDIFGVESDIDGDGRVGLVFSPLTKDSAVAFFMGCDLLPSLLGCAGGNTGEYIYLTPPGDIAPPYNTPAAIKEILAHELGHLFHFNRKVLRNKLTTWPDGTNLIEGFGGFAQDTVGFQAGNLYVTQAGLDGIASFSLTDVFNDAARTDPARDGVLRGGSYLFVRYLYDRAGGDAVGADGSIESRGGPALLRALLDVPGSVAATLPSIVTGGTADLALDFYTTLAMSNANEDKTSSRHAPLNPCFSYLPTLVDPVTGKQRGADMFASFHGMAMKGPAMKPAGDGGTLRSGGVEYLTLAAQPGQAELDLTITVDEKSLPRVRIARLE
jgi:hypothetical protein